jgi:dihydrodipicolinate synthase/N-acetylneuraminate lyase
VLAHVGGRVPVVTADRFYHTRQAVSFARECRELGSALHMVLPPDWGKSTTPASLAAHYAAVAEEMPVMVVTNLFIPRGPDFGMAAVEAALEASENIVSVKDDMGGLFAQEMTARFSDRCAIWAGGRKQNHMLMAPFGAHGYLSTFLTFQPEVSDRYWQAWQAGRIAEAAEVIETIDIPFFNLISTMPGGFDAAIHGVMELKGLSGRWRPAPYHTLSDGEMEDLAEGLKKIGI